MRTIKAAELVIDFDLYPRNNVDSHNVRTLIDALASGVELPPIIIDKKSKRVADGVHRTRAYLQHYGPDHPVEVIEKNYKNDAELFLDAMRYNGSHGAKLDPCDRTHCVIIGERLGLTIDAIAGALHMPTDKLGGLRESRTATAGTLTVPLKRTFRHMAGRRLTKEQVAANERSSGMNPAFYANQLIDMIEAKMIELDDESLRERLSHLNQVLSNLLLE